MKILDISEEQLDKLCLLINLERKFKLKKFINKEDKVRTLIGGILIRNFNISHSGDFMVCRVDDKPIGIVIEQVH